MELRLSLIRSPNYSETINVDEDLQDYFSEPRNVKKNEQIVIHPLLQPELEVYFIVSFVTGDEAIVSGDNCRIVVDSKKTRPEKIHRPLSNTDETLAFASQRLCQMLKTFDVQWSKQTSIPTILLHGLNHFDDLIDYSCRQTGFHCHTVSSQLLAGDSAAATIKRIELALQTASKSTPCVVFFNHINYLCKLTDVEHDDTIVSNGFRKLLQQIQSSSMSEGPLIVVAAVTRLHLLSEQVLSLFSYTISIPSIPMDIRKRWLYNRLSKVTVAPDFNYDLILAQTKGWPIIEIDQLIRLTVEAASTRMLNDASETTLTLTNVDFETALKKSHTSKLTSQRKAMIPNVRWTDIGGLAVAKKEILNTIQLPLLHPDVFGDLARTGILLYGPPGSGKTLLAKAVATEFSLNFLSVRGPELLNMYVGQSEQNVRDLFERARAASPCILFFDELDSLAPRRGRTSSDSSGVSDRLVSQLLTEIDQKQIEQHIFIIGATNRPDLLDDALLRPGRFDKLIYIGVTNEHEDRRQMFDALTQKFTINDKNFDADEFVRSCPLNMTGADFYALASDAYLRAIRRLITNKRTNNGKDDEHVTLVKEDFNEALADFQPSLDLNEIKQYERLQKS